MLCHELIKISLMYLYHGIHEIHGLVITNHATHSHSVTSECSFSPPSIDMEMSMSHIVEFSKWFMLNFPTQNEEKIYL